MRWLLKKQVNCVECALGAESNPQNAVATYQSLIDGMSQYRIESLLRDNTEELC